jgi:tetratricopeptide (TPR) repeat protein
MKHVTLSLLAAGLVGVSSGCQRAEPATDPAPVASRACQIALAPGPEPADVDRKIAELQARIRQQPYDSRLALEQLGHQLVARARLTNDDGDYTLAAHTAECLESRHPGDPAALLLRGHALHQLHRFREAEAAARMLVAKRQYALDYGLLGDALMEQGRLMEAANAYQKMIDIKPFYQSYVRAAHLRWLKGDLEGAIDLIHKAIQAASPRDRESVAWAYTRLAGYELQRGRLDAAKGATDGALTYQPEYAPALLAQGRVLLSLSRPVDAVATLRRAAAANPLPEYQWILADALRLTKNESEAQAVEQDLIARGARSDPRTLALFLATRGERLDTALALTERELVQRADIFTHDARAWALAAAGRIDEAQAEMTRALAENTHDARLFLHAGLISASAGRPEDARRWLEKAHRLRTALLPSEIEMLRHDRFEPTRNQTGG